MPSISIPLTTYSIKQTNPAHMYGSTSAIPLRNGGAGDLRMLCRVPLDKVPEDATITSAVLQIWTSEADTGTIVMRAYPITEKWKSSVTWNTRPPLDILIDSDSHTNPPINTLYELDVTSWAATRARLGVSIDVSSTTVGHARGSASSINKPVLLVDYTIIPETPSNLVPNGGAVSVEAPILGYEAEEDMTQQTVQFSGDGTVGGIFFDTGWVTASIGRFDPAGTGSPILGASAELWWRVKTNGPNGESAYSVWANYSYEPIVDPVITNPPATTDDGSPTLQWTVTDQTSWRASFYNGSKLLDNVPWDEDSVTRDWTPGKSVAVPGGSGRFVLNVKDDVTPRVAAEGAPTWSSIAVTFDTVVSGSGPLVSGLVVAYDDPVPVITGNRAAGIPDYVALFRDGVSVPLWDNDGEAHKWAPAADFFSGGDFTLRDYTAEPRADHTWTVSTRVGSTTSGVGPEVSLRIATPSVWLVNPRTGEQIEIQGYGDVPVLDQSVEEGAILHTPIHGDLVVEPVRRRLLRTTRMGAIEGVVLNEAEDILADWVLQDSGLKYRLIFGKVNWSVIIGDYSPSDMFYADDCGDDRVLVVFNWWERLADY